MSNAKVFEDAFNMLCGAIIGEGIHRKVFECKLRPDLVVKVEYAEDYRFFANVMEMRFWNDASEPMKRWLAPCEYLSPDGLLLLQKKVDAVPSSYEMPEQMPSFMMDFKRNNFGILNGKLVCLDYAMTIASHNLKLKKVGW